MELTLYASWLNDVFSLFDTFFLGICHELAVSYGDVLTPIADALDSAGHWGIAFIVLALVLMLFKKTRMAGFAILLAIAIAGGLSEFVIKDIVARPRPFESSDLFYSWWQFVGSPDVSGTSFPSGHVAGATAAMIALAYAARHWWASLAGVVVIVAMMFDRMYLQVHYPSDVLAGFILGFFAGIVGYAIIQGIWRLLGKHPDQIAEREARKAARGRNAEMTIPRGVDRMDYAAVGMAQAASPAAWQQRPQTESARRRYAENTVPQTLQTSSGDRVVVPPMPANPNARATQSMGAAPGATQAMRPQAAATQAFGGDPDATQAVGTATRQPTAADAGGATQAMPRAAEASSARPASGTAARSVAAQPTQVIGQAGGGKAASRAEDSGLQMAEEYYPE